MTWNSVLWILGGLWVVGWLVNGLLSLANGRLYRRPGATNDTVHDKFMAFLIYFGWWPLLVGPTVQQFRFYYAVRQGKIPDWVLFAEGEDSNINWTPSGGAPAFASANAGDRESPSFLLFDFEDEKVTAHIEYRVRMVGPTKENWPEQWKQMKFDASPVESELSRYQVELRLGPGKYAAAFRVRAESGNFEESPVATMIVDPDGVEGYFA